MKRLLFLYFVLRIPLLLSPLEDISIELRRGAITHYLIHGLKLPFWDYTADNYGLGSLVTGALTVPFFLIFGESWFALKFTPFVWHLFSLIAWFWIWKKYFSEKKAFWISLFFILPPPLITEYSLTNNGYHFEMILWMAISLLLLGRMLEKKISETTGGFLLGLVGGFSTMMVLTNLVMVLVLFVYLFLYAPKDFRKKYFLGCYSVAFLLGFSPMLLFNYTYGWPTFSFFTSTLFGSGAGISLNDFPNFFKEALIGLFSFRQLSPSVSFALAFGYAVCFLVALFYLGYRIRGRLFQRKSGLDIEVFGFLFSIILMGIVAFASGRAFAQYLFPMVPFVGMTIVLAVEGKARWFRWTSAFCFITAGLVGNFSIVSLGEIGKSLSMPGFSKYESVNNTLEFVFGHDPDLFRKKSLLLIKNEDADFKRVFFEGTSGELFRVESPKDIESALAYIQEIEAPFHPILYDRLGVALGPFCQFDLARLRKWLKTYAVPVAMQKYLFPGFVQALNWSQDFQAKRFEVGQQICAATFGEEKQYCEVGLSRLDH